MSIEFFEHEFTRFNEEEKKQYIVENFNWAICPDKNGNNYPNGWVNIDTNSMTGANQIVDAAISESFIDLPITCIVELNNLNSSNGLDDINPENLFCLKSFNNLIEQIKFFSNVEMFNKDNLPLYTNQILNNMTKEQQNKYKEILCYFESDMKNITFDKNKKLILEYIDTGLKLIDMGDTSAKDSAEPIFLNTVYKADPYMGQEKSFVSRSLAQNYSNTGFSTKSALFDVAANNTVYENYYEINTLKDSIDIIGYQIIYHYKIRIALKYLPYFSNFPCSSIGNKLSFSFQTNIDKNNTYKLNIKNGVKDTLLTDFTSVEYNQNIGTVCPFSLNFGELKKLKILDDGDAYIKISSFIGYTNDKDAYGVRWIVPVCKYTAPIKEALLKSPLYQMKFNDFDVDNTLMNRDPGVKNRVIINSTASRLRKLYILPYFANVGGYEINLSPLSNSPSQMSFCRLKDLQISVGGTNLFQDKLNYTDDFYLQNNFYIDGNTNGNALNNLNFSGLIDKANWLAGNNFYCFQLEKFVVDEAGDNQTKQIIVEFSTLPFKQEVLTGTSGTDKLKYNFYIIVEYEKMYNINRAGCFVQVA